MTLQGFLLTALTFGSNALASSTNAKQHVLIYILLIFVSIMGFVSGFLVSPGIRQTRRFIAATELWWIKTEKQADYLQECPYPCLEPQKGGYQSLDTEDKDFIDNRSFFSIDRLPALLMPIWWGAVLVIALFFSFFTGTWERALARPNSATTTATIIDQANGNITLKIDFDGDQSQMKNLERRLSEILKKQE